MSGPRRTVLAPLLPLLGVVGFCGAARAQTAYFGRPFAGVELEPEALAQDSAEGIDETRGPRPPRGLRTQAEVQVEAGLDPGERAWDGGVQITGSVVRRWGAQAGFRVDVAQVEDGASVGFTETLVVAPPWRLGAVSFAAIPFASQGRRDRLGGYAATQLRSPLRDRWRYDVRAAVGGERDFAVGGAGLLAFLFAGVGRNLDAEHSLSLALLGSTERLRTGPARTTVQLEPLWRAGETKIALDLSTPTDELQPHIGLWVGQSF